jgi:uncharacterized RDD family membrane protein YckC
VAERVYSIETPENLTLYFERAGFASRVLALGLDVLLMGAVTQSTLWLLMSLGAVAESLASTLWILVGFLVQWGYGAFSEWHFAGRTLGKRLTGLAVVDLSGLPLSFFQAAVRNLLRIVDLLPGFYLLGALSALVDPNGRRMGDLAARTIVGRARRALPPKEPAPTRSAAHEPWAGPILHQLRNDERRALVALHGALDALSLADRVALCGALVAHLARRHQLSLPVHLSAERVISLLYGALPSAVEARGSAREQDSKARASKTSSTKTGARAQES